MADAGVLEQFFPQVFLLNRDRSTVVGHLETAFRKIADEADPEERRALSMSGVVTACQKLKFFGAAFWLGRQQEAPQEKWSVDNAPSKHYLVNPREPKADYYVAVTWDSVGLCAQGNTASLSRTFFFNEEKAERALFWGAKEEFFQLIISTVDQAEPSRGRHPMRIDIRSPSALDILFFVHCIHMEKQNIQF